MAVLSLFSGEVWVVIFLALILKLPLFGVLAAIWIAFRKFDEDRPASGPFWSALVVSALQAGRAELVVFLHDLLKFVSRAADHLVLIVVVLERATCGPVQDSLIKLPELRFWDIDVLGGPVRVALYMPGAEDLLGEGFDVHRAIRAPGHVGWPER